MKTKQIFNIIKGVTGFLKELGHAVYRVQTVPN